MTNSEYRNLLIEEKINEMIIEIINKRGRLCEALGNADTDDIERALVVCLTCDDDEMRAAKDKVFAALRGYYKTLQGSAEETINDQYADDEPSPQINCSSEWYQSGHGAGDFS